MKLLLVHLCVCASQRIAILIIFSDLISITVFNKVFLPFFLMETNLFSELESRISLLLSDSMHA